MESEALDPLAQSESVAAVASNTPHETLSIIDLVAKADPIVMIVMAFIIIASIVSWAVIFERSYFLNKLNKNFKIFEDLFWSGTTLENIQQKLENNTRSPVERVFMRAMNERDRCLRDGFSFEFSQERIENIVDLSIQKESENLEGQTGFLATVGSVAPFVGLFGTVWGIMNSFTAIANTNNTSLAVVAPGIAEALFVTAMGLAAAIPAVIAYNKINKSVDKYYNKLSNFSDELVGVLNKHLYQNFYKS